MYSPHPASPGTNARRRTASLLGTLVLASGAAAGVAAPAHAAAPVLCPVGFTSPVDHATGTGPLSLATADLNGDGRTDIVTANANEDSVSVLLGDGDGTFQPAADTTVAPGPRHVVTHDFNADGHTDLAVTDGYAARVHTLLGNGDGTFDPAVTLTLSGATSTDITAADVNGDGRTDLAVVVPSTGLWVMPGNGDGTFGPAVNHASTSTQAVVTGDFDTDGRIDLAFAVDGSMGGSRYVGVRRGVGDGAFHPVVTYYAGGAQYRHLTMADVDGDGTTDLLAASIYGGVSVLTGVGDGTFQPGPDHVLGAQPEDVLADDVDGDGDADLLATTRQPGPFDPGHLLVLPGNGDGTFASAVTYHPGNAPQQIVTGDFDGDGRKDAAIANISANAVSVLMDACAPTAPTTPVPATPAPAPAPPAKPKPAPKPKSEPDAKAAAKAKAAAAAKAKAAAAAKAKAAAAAKAKAAQLKLKKLKAQKGAGRG
ncbi:FG-GAP repeat domain-containing protein [Planomonospora parontospora]|uniref:FG-GAP repeat domain-containing protein n=1 Tax=Planomonospora parontospora TaxID=58119 RepID=UPI0016710DD3|nr:VCBS repeat-containing protein [Planomonospora parontospora]GGL43529.1 hypothetical protein GCM10014719_51140 [Planomonospora parontospora subsp. antibiotica]GII18438.1 hypothetical protein Ppa05_51640 [Planomonospora parontospora subsp. antibiotica]